MQNIIQKAKELFKQEDRLLEFEKYMERHKLPPGNFENESDKKEEWTPQLTKKRPKELMGSVTCIRTGLGKLYVIITEYEGRPFEVFAVIGKSGKSTTAKTEAIGRLISLCLRSGIEVEKVIRQIKGISGESPVFQEGSLILSIPDAIGKVLEKKYIKKEDRVSGITDLLNVKNCPDCGGKNVIYEEGCSKCHDCGWSECG